MFDQEKIVKLDGTVTKNDISHIGNIATNNSSNITISVASGPGALSGTFTSVRTVRVAGGCVAVPAARLPVDWR